MAHPTPFPSGKPLAFLHPTPVPCFPRDPSQPHTASHPMTVTNDRITNPRSTDMFTRMTYALTKSKWERDQGKKGCKVSCRILCNPEDGWHWTRSSRFHGQRGHSHLQLLDCGGPVNTVWRERSTWWAQVSKNISIHIHPSPYHACWASQIRRTDKG